MNQDKIEEVKRILECESDLCLDPTSVGADDCGNESHSYACIDCQALQICQLFEPRKVEDLPEEEQRILAEEAELETKPEKVECKKQA